MSELQKDVEREVAKLPEAEREAKRTKFAVFVVHNKLKDKVADLPADVPYYSGAPNIPFPGGDAHIPVSRTGSDVEDKW